MNRRLGFTIVAALVLVAGGIGGYLWYSGSGNEGSAQSTLDLINNKLARNGQPTLPPDTVPFSPRITPSSATSSPLPVAPSSAGSPIPQPGCGAGGIAGLDDIVATYGPLRGACGTYGNLIIFTTQGTANGPGGIGIFECAAADSSCLKGDYPEHPGSWSFYPGPKNGAVKIFFYHAEGQDLIIDSGGLQTCFELTTRSYCQ